VNGIWTLVLVVLRNSWEAETKLQLFFAVNERTMAMSCLQVSRINFWFIVWPIFSFSF
jgi:hypothetical protein